MDSGFHFLDEDIRSALFKRIKLYWHIINIFSHKTCIIIMAYYLFPRVSVKVKFLPLILNTEMIF